MSRNKKDQGKDHFDLLPFIAILMCVLGSLLLVTMSIAALSIGPSLGEGWIPKRDQNMASKTPILIEWDGTTATVHSQGRKVQFKWTYSPRRIEIDGTWYNLGQSNEEYDPELKKLLDELES